MRTIVFDVAASEGGALTILNSYYNKALNDDSRQWVFVVSSPTLIESNHVKVLSYRWVKKSWLHRLYFDYVIAPSLVKKSRADSVLSLQNTAIPRTKVPLTIYFHQPLPLSDIRFKFYQNTRFWVYQNIISTFIAKSLRRADTIIVQTKWIASAIIDKWDIKPEQIDIQPPQFDTDIRYSPPKNTRTNYVYPAGPYEYKNHLVIIKALRSISDSSPDTLNKISILFTITGRENKYTQSLMRAVDIDKLPIKFIGSKTHDELLSLMTRCTLIFPSKLETFGLPLLEARKINAPIVSAITPFSSEILNGYRKATFFQADDWASLALILRTHIKPGALGRAGKVIELNKVLFIGGMYDRASEKVYLSKSKGGIQGAVNAHQWSIVEGLNQQPSTYVKILSAPFLSPYPKYKDISVKPIKNRNFYSIGYLNIPVIKEVVRTVRLVISVRSITKDLPNVKIVSYYLSIPQMIASILGKRTSTITLIIPDMPAYLNLSKKTSFTSAAYCALKRHLMQYLIKKFDKYILLTKYMAEELRLETNSWMVVEGLVQEDIVTPEKSITKRTYPNHDVIYSGSLHEVYGVNNLIKAIRLIKSPTVQFYFYGSGELSEKLTDLQKKDNRIHFMGYTDRESVLQHQKNALALINPRGTEGEYVKLSFPSKNLEYLASGTPAIFMNLPCIPKEYYPHFIHLIDNTPACIANTIDDVANMPANELNSLAAGAVNFVSRSKTAKVQAKKIMEFIYGN